MLHLHSTGVQVWWSAISHRGQNVSGAAPRVKPRLTLDVSTHVSCLARNHSFFSQWRIVINSSEGRKRATLNNKLKLPEFDHLIFILLLRRLQIQPHIKWRNRIKWSIKTLRLGTFFFFFLFFRRTKTFAVFFVMSLFLFLFATKTEVLLFLSFFGLDYRVHGVIRTQTEVRTLANTCWTVCIDVFASTF